MEETYHLADATTASCDQDDFALASEQIGDLEGRHERTLIREYGSVMKDVGRVQYGARDRSSEQPQVTCS
jgi:hypothetical protein